jgi:hypothetical protein
VEKAKPPRPKRAIFIVLSLIHMNKAGKIAIGLVVLAIAERVECSCRPEGLDDAGQSAGRLFHAFLGRNLRQE